MQVSQKVLSQIILIWMWNIWGKIYKYDLKKQNKTTAFEKKYHTCNFFTLIGKIIPDKLLIEKMQIVAYRNNVETG